MTIASSARLFVDHSALALLSGRPPVDKEGADATPAGIIALFALLFLWMRTDYLLDLPLPEVLALVIWVFVDVTLVVALFATVGRHRTARRWGWTFLVYDCAVAAWYFDLSDRLPTCASYYGINAVISVVTGGLLALAVAERLPGQREMLWAAWTVVIGVTCGWLAHDIAAAIQAPPSCLDFEVAVDVEPAFYQQAVQIIPTLIVAVLVDLAVPHARATAPVMSDTPDHGVSPRLVVVLLALASAALGLIFALASTVGKHDFEPAFALTVAAIAQLIAALGVLVVDRISSATAV